jgi:hypothetical protein
MSQIWKSKTLILGGVFFVQAFGFSTWINGPNYSPDFQKTKFDITIFVQQAPPTSQKANKILNISYIHVWSVAKFS